MKICKELFFIDLFNKKIKEFDPFLLNKEVYFFTKGMILRLH